MVGGRGGVVRHPARCALGVICMSINLVDPAEDMHVLLLFDLFVCLAKKSRGVCLRTYAGLRFAVGWGEVLSLCPVSLFSIYIMKPFPV